MANKSKLIGFSKGFRLAIHTDKVCSFCNAPGVTSTPVKSPIANKYICHICVKDIKEIFDGNKSNK